jgi:chaperonin GroES
MNLKPLDDRIVVRPAEPETQTASGLVIPDTAKEKPQQGEVLDTVLYSKYGGTEVASGGEDLLVLNSRDVLAIVG